MTHIGDKGSGRSSQQSLLQNGFQPVMKLGRCLLAFLQIGQQLGVAVVFLDGVRVLEIKVETASLDLVDRNLPGDLISLTLPPPSITPGEIDPFIPKLSCPVKGITKHENS